MEKDGEILYNSKYTKHVKINSHSKKKFCILFLILFVNIGSIFFDFINRKESNNLLNLLNIKLLKYKEELSRIRSFIDKLILFYDKEKKTKDINQFLNANMFNTNNRTIYSYKEYNEIINEKYIHEQKFFCEHQDIFYNQKFEDIIRLTDINFNKLNYKMFVYKKDDIVSNQIIRTKSYEKHQTNILLEGLNYYKNKYNIKPEDMYILDIGANIGWYSICLGKYGYKILSFEPMLINTYILKKNYCLNKALNITIINKGLSTQEKKCDIYNVIGNRGDAMVVCEKNKKILPGFKKQGEIILTKLSNYIYFLSKNNLVLIKIDVEGLEGKVIEGGIEIITKYHVPFIFMEFFPRYLKLHDTEPIQFLKIFENNGYKMSPINFFDEKNYSAEDIVRMTTGFINLYFVHSKILNKK